MRAELRILGAHPGLPHNGCPEALAGCPAPCARAAPPPLATRLLYREAQVCANRGPRLGPCTSAHFVPTRSSRRPLPQLTRSASR